VPSHRRGFASVAAAVSDDPAIVFIESNAVAGRCPDHRRLSKVAGRTRWAQRSRSQTSIL